MNTYESREEKRIVVETMSDLLLPLKNHCDERTKNAIDSTLWILMNMGVKE